LGDGSAGFTVSSVSTVDLHTAARDTRCTRGAAAAAGTYVEPGILPVVLTALNNAVEILRKIGVACFKS
jgi:hypothetical protein